MKLEIITTQSNALYEIAGIEVTSSKGSVVVQEGHAPTFLIWDGKAPLVFLTADGKTEIISGKSGLVAVDRAHITVVLGE